eukprot:COSAG02_NODE_2610_length_8431_cov_94.540206_6_plen_110_part_00
MQPIMADQVENRVAFRNRLNPAGNAAMSDATLSAKLQQGEMRQALLLGVEREIVTENGRCNRLARARGRARGPRCATESRAARAPGPAGAVALGGTISIISLEPRLSIG